ncbi:hypothetical protein Pan241w_50690 [Gimesia alba]|uniref:Uncharacterized protein n=1 Tax=Gimesia alba TaxID=2527973 RepID=A0A517RMC8_9PLAN|nr:hypothetical protein Pan241w_50690 [Gimesia alba]
MLRMTGPKIVRITLLITTRSQKGAGDPLFNLQFLVF